MKYVILIVTLLVTGIFLFNQIEWLGYLKAGEWSLIRNFIGEVFL